MKLIEPNIECISEKDRVFKVTCPRFVAEYLRKRWNPDKIQIDDTKYIQPNQYYPEQRELVFVMPTNSRGHIKPGSYEYDEWPNTPSGLACHVEGPETYVAQHMGGSGDSQYNFVKGLCDISDAIVTIMENYGSQHTTYVTKPVEGKKNVVTNKMVDTLAPMSYCLQIVPPIAATQVIIWGENEEFFKLSVDTGDLEPEDLRWYVSWLQSFSYHLKDKTEGK